MLPRGLRILRLFFEAIGILVCIAGLVFVIAPGKVIHVASLFPTFDPFAKSIEASIPAVGKDMSEVLPVSELRKTRLAVNDGSMRNVIVYLPPGYNPKGTSRYPSLYLLHGSPGLETDWLIGGKARATLDRAIAAKILPPMIVVFPDGNGGLTRDTQYINSTDRKQLNEDFIVKTLVGYIDSHFLTIKDAKHRAIGGLSAGGFGAINMALHHQDVFGYVVSFSGYGRIDRNVASNRLIQGSRRTIRNNSPLDYIPRLKTTSTKLILIVGREDLGQVADNRALELALAKKGFHVTLTVANGVHDWAFWREHLLHGLLWLGRQLEGVKR